MAIRKKSAAFGWKYGTAGASAAVERREALRTDRKARAAPPKRCLYSFAPFGAPLPQLFWGQ